MNNYCAFSKNHMCPKWVDYQVSRQELEELDELCHDNWIEIQRKQRYIEALQDLLSQNEIAFPDEYDF